MGDVSRTAHAAHDDPSLVYESSKLGIWVFLLTEALLFGGLFMAYTVYRIKYPGLFYDGHLELNRVMGAANTVVLICSSLSVAAGIAAIKQGKVAVLKACLAATILLGAAFMTIKYIEWSHDFAVGITPGTDIFFSLYFMMVGLHGLHVLGGMGVLAVLLVMTFRGAFSASYSTPVEVAGVYWHFVDLVWIYLFPLFYLIG